MSAVVSIEHQKSRDDEERYNQIWDAKSPRLQVEKLSSFFPRAGYLSNWVVDDTNRDDLAGLSLN